MTKLIPLLYQALILVKGKAFRQPTKGFYKFDLVRNYKTLSTFSSGKLNASATPS